MVPQSLLVTQCVGGRAGDGSVLELAGSIRGLGGENPSSYGLWILHFRLDRVASRTQASVEVVLPSHWTSGRSCSSTLSQLSTLLSRSQATLESIVHDRILGQTVGGTSTTVQMLLPPDQGGRQGCYSSDDEGRPLSVSSFADLLGTYLVSGQCLVICKCDSKPEQPGSFTQPQNFQFISTKHFHERASMAPDRLSDSTCHTGSGTYLTTPTTVLRALRALRGGLWSRRNTGFRYLRCLKSLLPADYAQP